MTKNNDCRKVGEKSAQCDKLGRASWGQINFQYAQVYIYIYIYIDSQKIYIYIYTHTLDLRLKWVCMGPKLCGVLQV